MWNPDDEFDDDVTEEDEDSEDRIALQAIEALLEVEGDSELAWASREALASIGESVLALKACREEREQLEQQELESAHARRRALARQQAEAERARQDAHAKQEAEAERARRLARKNRSEQRARARQRERSRLDDEARRISRERESLRAEQVAWEAARRQERERAAARKRSRARASAEWERLDAERLPKQAQGEERRRVHPRAGKERPRVDCTTAARPRLAASKRRRASSRRPSAGTQQRSRPAAPVAPPFRVAEDASTIRQMPATRDDQPLLTGVDLSSWRSRLGLTQQAAASRLGVGQGTISKAESRDGVPLGPTLLRALAFALASESRSS